MGVEEFEAFRKAKKQQELEMLTTEEKELLEFGDMDTLTDSEDEREKLRLIDEKQESEFQARV